MDVYLLRHGTAEYAAHRDQDRRLSADGREGLNFVLNECAQELSLIDRTLASPFVRTQQTLNIALPFMPLVTEDRCETVEFLTPGGNPSKVLEWLEMHQPQSVLIVTHQPLIGTLLDELCGLEPGQYRMGTGALAAVKLKVVAKGLGELMWLKQAQR